MVVDELVPIIREKFKQGNRRNEIKEDLMGQGYYEEDIDAAIQEIQHDAIKQLPIISSIYEFIEDFEKKSNLTTTRMTVLLMVACVGLLLLMAAGLYFIFDPLGTGSTARDAQRLSDVAKMQTALGFYYQQNGKYPASLNKLVPTFLSTLPRDPQSGEDYSYKLIDNTSNYELCSSYELQPEQCVNALPATSNIPIIPTATPAKPFVPQSASGSGGGL